MTIYEWMGLVGAISMPIFNIPLIVRIIRRGTSNDISKMWVIGVWVCVMLMLPSSMVSADKVLRIFGIVNAIAFTVVFVTVIRYHHRPPK